MNNFLKAHLHQIKTFESSRKVRMYIFLYQWLKLVSHLKVASETQILNGQSYGTSYRAHHFGLQLLNLTSQHRFRSERCSEPTNADCVLLLLLKDVFRDTDTMTIISPGFIPGGLLPLGLLLYGLFNKLLYLQVIQYSTSMNYVDVVFRIFFYGSELFKQ